MKEEKAIKLIIREYARASKKYGKFPSTHHGYAVIKEELDELWDEIICRGPARYMEDEAKQIGAMALRFLVDLC